MTRVSEGRTVSDQAQRDRALAPDASFIVQAPAGSGKTGLLIQRYLALLATVERPEEILAITFTRKAAGEMRERVLAALHGARGELPAEIHARRTWELARSALARDGQQGWELAAHPGRLRIQTIDSLCAELTRQLPLAAGFGAPPAIAEQGRELYREAARATLALLDGDDDWGGAVAHLARHLDNDFPYLETLLADMLARRDHWLRLVADRSNTQLQREALEAALGRLVDEQIQALAAGWPEASRARLPPLARYAAEQLAAAGRESPIVAWRDPTSWPAPTADHLPLWQGLAELLLTAKGEWRSRVTEAVGFPAPGGAKGEEKAQRQHHKAQIGEAIDALRHDTALAQRLHEVRELPPARYDERQWAVLDALLTLLPVAVAQLKLVFQGHGGIDFAEVAMAASQALGEPQAPTDLALALDYRIRHILVDEFQDTSLRQYELLARLTAGWTPDDGRTLFVVGDPMQSIYRFREAEVGLYLRARREGLAGVPLEALTLGVNFRSQGGVVEWVNGAFPAIFPADEDALRGGVSYRPSLAFRASAGAAVAVHPFFGRDHGGEAAQVVRLVQEACARRPQGSLAILVRSRTHLARILPALRQAGLRYQAVEIETLGERPVVRDLLALTRALLHPADRIAWLAVLRAPWCGLTLADLTAVAGEASRAILWERMNDPALLAALSDDGRTRLARLCAVVAPFLARRRAQPLRRWVEGAWLALGGPATCAAPGDLADAATYLDLLDELEVGGDLPGLVPLAERVELLYAAPDSGADAGLQVMTIHKAKGLEFDTVIVPGLGRRPTPGSEPLLRWLEIPRGGGEDLVLAPIRARNDDADPISRTLKRLDGERCRNEDARLLYVAATRAREALHLLGHCPLDAKGDETRLGRPESRSLLERLWPAVEAEYRAQFDAAGSAAEPQAESGPPDAPPLQRLTTQWVAPPPPAAVAVGAVQPAPAAEEGEIEFEWAGDTARCVGIVVHALLQRVGREGLAAWPAERVASCASAITRALAGQGVPRDERQRATRSVQEALKRSLGDPRGRWLLDTRHCEAVVEWPLAGVDGNQVVHVVLDRSFVDDQGVRWIVDYKTGAHEGPDREAFLDNEQMRYRPQLERYARLLAARETRPIRLGLYFPLLGGWREWEFVG